MSTRTSTDWSLPAASVGAPVLGSDQSACPAFGNYILISRSSCPTNGVHFSLPSVTAYHKNSDTVNSIPLIVPTPLVCYLVSNAHRIFSGKG